VYRHPGIAEINAAESINHTNHPPLLSNPIVISIETKAAAPNQEEAELQMGVWMAAHFARLRGLVLGQCERQQQSGASSVFGDNAEMETTWRQAVEELGFLPGLLVLQHQWFFVAATWTPPPPPGGSANYWGHGVTLWRKIGIGSTAKPEGVCQVISVVRHLGRWAEGTYWPWFKKWALGEGTGHEGI